MVSGINNNIQNLNIANDAMNIGKAALGLALELNPTNQIQTLNTIGDLFKNLGSLVGSTPKQAVAAQPPINKQLSDLVNQLTNALTGLNQALTGLKGAGGAAPAGGAGAAGGAGGAQGAGQTDMSKLFGTGAFEQDADGSKAAKTKAAASGDAPKSLGALLALVGRVLVKAMEDTMKQLAGLAKKLDAATADGGKGPTASLNQEIQEKTFNLQQIQQTLNRVNETVTNLSKAESDAMRSIATNLKP